MLEGIESMEMCIRDSLFSDVDITKEVKEYYQELYGVSLTDEQVDRMYNPSDAAADGFSKVN